MTFSGEIFIYNGDRQWTKAKIGQTVLRSNSVAVSPATQIENSRHPGYKLNGSLNYEENDFPGLTTVICTCDKIYTTGDTLNKWYEKNI